MLGGEGCLDPGVRGLLPEAPDGLGPAPWPRTPPSTEREARGAFCTMEKPEGREWPSLLGEGSGASPSSHRQRQGPSGLLVGVGCSVSHHLGTQEVKPKVGRGGVTAPGPGSPAGSWVCEALPVA